MSRRFLTLKMILDNSNAADCISHWILTQGSGLESWKMYSLPVVSATGRVYVFYRWGFLLIRRTFIKCLSWTSPICFFKYTLYPFILALAQGDWPAWVASTGLPCHLAVIWVQPVGDQRQEERGIWMFISLTSSQLNSSLLFPSAKHHGSCTQFLTLSYSPMFP